MCRRDTKAAVTVQEAVPPNRQKMRRGEERGKKKEEKKRRKKGGKKGGQNPRKNVKTSGHLYLDSRKNTSSNINARKLFSNEIADKRPGIYILTRKHIDLCGYGSKKAKNRARGRKQNPRKKAKTSGHLYLDS